MVRVRPGQLQTETRTLDLRAGQRAGVGRESLVRRGQAAEPGAEGQDLPEGDSRIQKPRAVRGSRACGGGSPHLPLTCSQTGSSICSQGQGPR